MVPFRDVAGAGLLVGLREKEAHQFDNSLRTQTPSRSGLCRSLAKESWL